MDHVAVMKKEWGFVEKILSGPKTIESRWYLTKHKPWDMVAAEDIIYFKNSADLVTARAWVEKVMQFENLNFKKVKEMLDEYGQDIGIEKKDLPEFLEKFQDKKYCILIFLKNPQIVQPFAINKKGFGAMASWITVKDICDIKI